MDAPVSPKRVNEVVGFKVHVNFEGNEEVVGNQGNLDIFLEAGIVLRPSRDFLNGINDVEHYDDVVSEEILENVLEDGTTPTETVTIQD